MQFTIAVSRGTGQRIVEGDGPSVFTFLDWKCPDLTATIVVEWEGDIPPTHSSMRKSNGCRIAVLNGYAIGNAPLVVKRVGIPLAEVTTVGNDLTIDVRNNRIVFT